MILKIVLGLAITSLIVSVSMDLEDAFPRLYAVGIALLLLGFVAACFLWGQYN